MTLAWTNARLGVSHALAHQIGARLHVPHGVTSCITLPAVMAWSLPWAQARLAVMAGKSLFDGNAEGEASLAQAVVVAVRELIAGLDLPTALDAYSPSKDDLEAIARLAHRELSGAGSRDAGVTVEELRGLLLSMLDSTAVAAQ